MAQRPPTEAAWLAKVRRLCARLGATEVERWGHPNWIANGTTFAAFERWKQRWSLAVKSTPAEQALLVQDPRFYVTPYVGAQGWVSAWLDQQPEWDLLATLLERAHAAASASAPKRGKASAPKGRTPSRAPGPRVVVKSTGRARRSTR